MDQTYTGGGECRKTKTHFARIVVSKGPDFHSEPYYEIMYYAPECRDFAIGYGSYDLGMVQGWMKRYFEVEGINDPLRYTKGMAFGDAIHAAKLGRMIARKGWNGKGMWVVYRTGYPDGIPANKNTADAVGIKEGELFKVRPYLQMKCVDGSFQMWLASQSDILADDWYIVE